MIRSRPRRGPNRVARAGLLLLLVLLIGAGIAGIASAYWLASGSGPGSATTATTVPVTLSPGAPAADLSPGGRADVLLTASNSNPSAVSVGSLALDTAQGTGGFAVDADHASCSTSALSFTTQSNSGAGWTVPAKVGAVNGTLPITLTNAVAMDIGAANACQGASFTIYLTAGS